MRRAVFGEVGARWVGSGLALALALALVGCVAPPEPGPREAMVRRAATDAEVPAELLFAIASVEGGMRLADKRRFSEEDHVPVAGVLELRHGRFDSLARGAELLDVEPRALVEDLELGTRAGARVLSELGHQDAVSPSARAGAPEAMAEWASAVERLSGHKTTEQRVSYRARVFRTLRFGGPIAGPHGEVIDLLPNESIPLSLTLEPPPSLPSGTPEYALAEWIETSCVDKCNTSRTQPIDMIAVHDTEGGWEASVATLQNDPGKSVHYIIDADGSRIAQFIPESYDGWHVGNSLYNNRMVGIEHVGFADVDDYQASLYQASALLVKDIAARHAIPLDRSHIVAHQEVPDGVNIPQSSPPCPDSPGTCIDSGNYGGFSHHTDPGVYWEWCQYMELVGGSCKCNDTFALWNCVHDLSMMNRCVDGQVEIVHCGEPCVVEPIGTDDHCVPAVEGTGGAGGGGAPSGSGGAASGGAAGTGGDAGTGGGAASGDDAEEGCSCSLAGAQSGGGALGLGLGAVGLAALRRRGQRAGVARGR